MSRAFEKFVPMIKSPDWKTDISRFWRPARVVAEGGDSLVTANWVGREKKAGMNLVEGKGKGKPNPGPSVRHLAAGKVYTVMKSLKMALDDITQTIEGTMRAARLPQERVEHLQELVKSIQDDVDILIKKLHQDGQQEPPWC